MATLPTYRAATVPLPRFGGARAPSADTPRGHLLAADLLAGITRSRWMAAVTAVLGLAWGAFAISWGWQGRPWPLLVWVPIQAAGASFLICGVVTWWRRPDMATGRLMAAVGISWYIGDFQIDSPPWLFAVSYWFYFTNCAFLVHLMLTIPNGRLTRPSERILAALVYASGPATQIPRYFDEEVLDLQLWGDPTLSTSIWADVSSVSALTLSGATVWMVVRRWRRSSKPLRRQHATAWATLATIIVNNMIFAVVCLMDSQGLLRQSLFFWYAMALILTPAALALGVLRLRMGRLRVAELVVKLQEADDPASLRAALAHALEDPTLDVVFWMPQRREYVDGDGQPVDLGAYRDRMVTEVCSRGTLLAAILHDPALRDQQPLVAPVAAAARLAIENAQLHACAQAQLAEVRATRARIISAADAERRRIQRDLHDGAQHRLLAIGMLLERVTENLPDGVDPLGSGTGVPAATGPGAGNLLTSARKELREAVRELRQLTEGIYPPALAEQGLAAAVDVLAERSPIPVITAIPPSRWPVRVEQAAYFVISEALANVYKHAAAGQVTISATLDDAPARRPQSGDLLLADPLGEQPDDGPALRVEIRDDGVGGAALDRGSGLAGLRDRVRAIGGALHVDSPPRQGTTIVVELPLGVPCGS